MTPPRFAGQVTHDLLAGYDPADILADIIRVTEHGFRVTEHGWGPNGLPEWDRRLFDARAENDLFPWLLDMALAGKLPTQTQWHTTDDEPFEHSRVWVWGPEMSYTDGMSDHRNLGVQMAAPEGAGSNYTRWAEPGTQDTVNEWWFEGVTHWAPVTVPVPPALLTEVE